MRIAPAAAVALATWCAPAQDVFNTNSAPSGGSPGIVVSITDFHNGNCDVKIKNPRTGYVHSRTIQCGKTAGFKPGEDIFETGDPQNPIRHPNGSSNPYPSVSPLPNVKPDPAAGSDFAKKVQDCLSRIQSMAAADPSSPVNRLLRELKTVPVTVQPRPANADSNETLPSDPAKPVTIWWSPSESGKYEDGAPKIPCATLLHELTHAWENYNHLDNGELAAVRAENWVLWKMNLKQRTRYVGVSLPPGQVIWPQAANPR